jgi:hypothetical protein
MAILAKCTKEKILVFYNVLIYKGFNPFQILAQSLH